MKIFLLVWSLPLLASAQSSMPSSQPLTTQAVFTSAPTSVRPPPKKEKDPDRGLALAVATSAVSYIGLGVGAQVFASGFTRGVTFGMLGLTGAVIGPSTGKIYLRKGGGRLVLTTALRFAASTTVITGLVLAGDQLSDCSLSKCALLYGGTTALVGLGLYDISTTRR
jgi:hypothetical protein